jgi:hypothetical protein
MNVNLRIYLNTSKQRLFTMELGNQKLPIWNRIIYLFDSRIFLIDQFK